MKRKRRKFTQEFKDEAVRLYLGSGKSQLEIAEDLGIAGNVLGRWVNSYQQSLERSSRPNETVEQENARLRAELDLVTRERDILKKSLGIVSRP